MVPYPCSLSDRPGGGFNDEGCWLRKVLTLMLRVTMMNRVWVFADMGWIGYDAVFGTIKKVVCNYGLELQYGFVCQRVWSFGMKLMMNSKK